MANEKITVTLSVDQETLNALRAHTAALERFCEMQAPPVTVTVEAPAPAPTPMAGSTGAGVDPTPVITVAGPVVPVAPVIPVVEEPKPVVPCATGFVAPTAPAAPAPEAPAVTVEQLMRAGVELMSRGVNAAALLTEFGVQAVTQIPKEKLPAFADRMRQLGANL